MKKTIPIVYFQGKAVLLDDTGFLSSMEDFLKAERHQILGFNTVAKALKRCKKSTKLSVLLPIDGILPEEVEGNAIELYVKRIVEISKSDKRDDVIPVVIADYDMPEMDGISFFKEINDKQSHKILLTGVADEKMAIKAFNEGIIDFYIQKGNPNLFNNLSQAIRKGREKYFRNESKAPIDVIKKNEPDCLVTSEEYYNFLQRQIERDNICEYYLIEGSRKKVRKFSVGV